MYCDCFIDRLVLFFYRPTHLFSGCKVLVFAFQRRLLLPFVYLHTHTCLFLVLIVVILVFVVFICVYIFDYKLQFAYVTFALFMYLVLTLMLLLLLLINNSVLVWLLLYSFHVNYIKSFRITTFLKLPKILSKPYEHFLNV